MSNSGGFAVTRTHSSDRFYNPPAIRRHQQLLLQQQQQLQRQLQGPLLKTENLVENGEVETRFDSVESTLSSPPPGLANLTNLDRLMESVTPFVPAKYFPEARKRGRRIHNSDDQPFYSLGDLWESYKEWSVYGVEVPLLLNGSDSVKQYYVPSLSGIQLYVDSQRLRRPGEDSDVESSRETISGGSSDCEAERRGKGVADGAWGQHYLMNLNSQRMIGLTLRDKPPTNSSGDEAEGCNSPGLLVFEYFEQEQPHHRQPLFDKVLSLASKFPELKTYKSSDLLPSSWISVAWYPIYRIPMGLSLQNLDASFLTFHCLSTHSKSNGQPQFHASSGRKVYGVDSSSKISLPVFGLASYKLRGSIVTPSGAHEWQQAQSLLQTAGNWLQRLQVKLPDYQFFVSHSSQWR